MNKRNDSTQKENLIVTIAHGVEVVSRTAQHLLTIFWLKWVLHIWKKLAYCAPSLTTTSQIAREKIELTKILNWYHTSFSEKLKQPKTTQGFSLIIIILDLDFFPRDIVKTSAHLSCWANVSCSKGWRGWAKQLSVCCAQRGVLAFQQHASTTRMKIAKWFFCQYLALV